MLFYSILSLVLALSFESLVLPLALKVKSLVLALALSLKSLLTSLIKLYRLAYSLLLTDVEQGGKGLQCYEG